MDNDCWKTHVILGSILGSEVSGVSDYVRTHSQMLIVRCCMRENHEIKNETPENKSENIMPFPVQVIPHPTAMIRYGLVW